MKLRIKICGLSTPHTLKAAVNAGADYLGFVFYKPSPRHVSNDLAGELQRLVPPEKSKVALIVNAEDPEIDEILRVLEPDIFQAHGSESPYRIREIRERYGKPVWKVVAVANSKDIAVHKTYDGAADLVLFDAKPPKSMKNALPGGNAISFDWSLLAQASIDMPWGLAGGLHPENVAEAVRISGASLVDTSSGVEHAPGIKDEALIAAFIKAARSDGSK